MKERRRLVSRAGWGVAHGFALLYAFVIIVPFLFLFLSSVRSNQEIFSNPLGLPTQWLWSNYLRAFTFADLGSALQISAVVTIIALAITIVLVVPASYGIARIQGGLLGKVVEGVFSSGLLIPSFSVLVPTFFIAVRLRVLNEPLYLACFLPATGLPISILLLVQFMRAIPISIDEAAMIDGASRWTILWRLIAPLSVPGIVTVMVFNFINYWNEYLFALVLLGGGNQITAQVALPMLKGERLVDYGLVAAGAVIVMLPILILYVLLREKTQVALTAGAVKE